MDFKKNKYTVIRNVVSKELCEFLEGYFLLKRKVFETFFQNKYISPFEKDWGVWNDGQVPNTYSHYADIAMETLLVKVMPVMQKHIGEKLLPTYSYARIYKKGDVLHRHKDRFSCEISTTLNLGGDLWPIFIDPTGEDNIIDQDKHIIKPSAHKGEKIILNQGDMLLYSGCDLEHWREPFEGIDCVQVFLHYNTYNVENLKNKFDGRPHLGLPMSFQM